MVRVKQVKNPAYGHTYIMTCSHCGNSWEEGNMNDINTLYNTYNQTDYCAGCPDDVVRRVGNYYDSNGNYVPPK